MGKAMQKIAANPVQSISIEECGHYIAEEQPEKLLEALLAFLQGPNPEHGMDIITIRRL